jgi:diguanylate cyclase (GGDEF)-like protein
MSQPHLHLPAHLSEQLAEHLPGGHARRRGSRWLAARKAARKRASRARTAARRVNQPLISGRAKAAGIAAGVAVAVDAIPLTRALVHRAQARAQQKRLDHLHDQRGLDPLTGLPNRAEALWWLSARLKRATTRNHRLAVMVLDLDEFAELNAIYGRAAGDHVLQVTAARLQAELRTGDIVCRSGNDTFLLIMDAVGPDHLVTRIGERLVSSVAEPVTFHGDSILATASLGFALSKERDSNANLLLDRADRALIQAKSSTRSIVQF